MARPNTSGPYAAAHFALELDNKQEVSLFRSIEGGGVKADVMTYQYGVNNQNGGYDRWKVLGKPKFEDIKLQVGMSMSYPFFNWIAEFFKGNPARKNGAIIAADFYYVERARRTFKEAMIKELTFPKLDATDKNAVYMNVALAVEELEFLPGNGEKLPQQAKNFDVAQKHWTANNFEFSLHGFPDQALRRVTKIDSFTIKQNIIEHNVGGFKKAIKTPSAVEFPNIVFYVPEADAQPFIDWMAKRVGFSGKGNGTVRDATKTFGSIQTYDNELKPIFTVEFGGADIVSIMRLMFGYAAKSHPMASALKAIIAPR
ncbi:MAG TPA: phage tail protein [Kofleriaceae bacterium]